MSKPPERTHNSFSRLFIRRRDNMSKARFFLLLLFLALAVFVMVSFLLRQNNRSITLNFTSEGDSYKTILSKGLAIDENLPEAEDLSEIISYNLDLPPRKLPDREVLMKLNPHLFSMIPREFLPNVQSPCWYEEFTDELASSLYQNNLYFLIYKEVEYNLGELKPKVPQYLQEINGKRYRLRCLPYVYLMGQPKSGTSDLFFRMKLHPQVGAVITKEPHWWTWIGFGQGFIPPRRPEGPLLKDVPLENYLDLFDLAARSIQSNIMENPSDTNSVQSILTVDGSTSIMWNHQVWGYYYNVSVEAEPNVLTMDFIHAVQPQAKFVAILRDPGERLYSEYLYCTEAKKSAQTFHVMVEESVQMFQDCLAKRTFRWCVYETQFNFEMPAKLSVGMYVVYIMDWLQLFGKENVYVIRFEDYANDLVGELNKAYSFLNIEPLNVQQGELVNSKSVFNARKEEDVPLGDMLPETKELLREFYWPFNRKLASVLEDERFLWNLDTVSELEDKKTL